MYFSQSELIFSATDLSTFSECEHRTALDLAVLAKRLERPGHDEIERLLLEKRGAEHEARVLEHYRASGRQITEIRVGAGDEQRKRGLAQTLDALRAGADVIYQAVLLDAGTSQDEGWYGRPDFLVRVPGASELGAFSYEVVDAKLSSLVKARAILQLCVYTEQLAALQGAEPLHFWVATGGADGAPAALRAAEFMAYYRAAKRRFLEFARGEGCAEPYPEPVEFCTVCSWWKRCEERRRADDHLSLVAGIARRQRDRLQAAGVACVAGLGALPPDQRVPGISDQALERIRNQARIQVAGRGEGRAIWELLLDAEPGTGLEALPEPTPGDLFLDLEGDPFVRGRGLEYLFGLVELGEISDDFMPREAPGEPRYHAFWALDPAEEKRAFEAVVDRIMRGLEEFRGLHVYHFGHRDADALKRLSCLHHTREEQMDEILRGGVLVDLHAIVKQSLRASVESYTLKQLERIHGFERRSDLRAAAKAMQLFGYWLESADRAIAPAELRAVIARYNEDDCLSAWRLRAWLEERRRELAAQTGRILRRPEPEERKASEPRQHESEETQAIAERLRRGLPADPLSDTELESARRLLAHLLDWHWREAKSAYWEYYRTRELPNSERVGDRAALGGLSFDRELAPHKKSRLFRYEFPDQEHAIRRTPEPEDPDTRKKVRIVEIGLNHVVIARGKALDVPHPRALIPGGPFDSDKQRARLRELGEFVAEHGFDDEPEHGAARDLLLRALPRCRAVPGAPLLRDGEDPVAGIERLALALDGSVLPVQGPPGSGKTHAAAHLICALVRAGRKVGVTANSHEVIQNVLRRAIEVSAAPLRVLHIDDAEDYKERSVPFEVMKDYAKLLTRLKNGELDVIGGTAWAWSRPELTGAVDVLIVDEAGQISLANTLAVAACARNLVLFGDPAQLDQPQKGVHPPGADASALEHLLGGALTLPPERGVLLAETRRLHPKICRFTSEVFYESRLVPIAGLENQCIDGPGVFSGSGLRFLAAPHSGNTNRADEEVAVIAEQLERLLGGSAHFTDESGARQPLSAKDLLVIAPYNAQVGELERCLPAGVAIGTVDKFQGKQAPIVIYSMTSSTAEDAPRGFEFLFSKNRLNVATSRARALVVLVGSPKLLQVRCKTPRQMQLVNALCRYFELAG